jgi:hypothetical protein
MPSKTSPCIKASLGQPALAARQADAATPFYDNMGNYEDAIRLFETCAQTFNERKQMTEVMNCMYHVGFARLGQRSFDLVEQLLTRCRELCGADQ